MKNPRTPEEVVELQAMILEHQRQVIIQLTKLIELHEENYNKFKDYMALDGFILPEVPKVKDMMKGNYESNLSNL